MKHHILDKSNSCKVNHDYAFFYNHILDKYNIRLLLLLPYLLEISHILSLNHLNYIEEDINKIIYLGEGRRQEKIQTAFYSVSDSH